MQKDFDYPDSVKEYMKAHYGQLPERSRRQYAAIESIKLGWGGQTYICKLLVLTQKTLRKGLQEIKNPEANTSFGTVRQRKIGGGPKFFLSKSQLLSSC
jgi:hypothetical protein